MSNKTPPFLQALASRAKGVGSFMKPDKPVTEAPPSYEEIVRGSWRQILARWMSGEAMEDIGKELKPIPVPGSEIRRIFRADPELRDRMGVAKTALAENLMDYAVRSAVKAERSGEYGVAIGGYLKAAGILDKTFVSNAKLSLEGNPDAPIPVQHGGEVRVKMAPDEAYMRMIGGGR